MAYKAVKENKVSVRLSAKLHGVPRSTLLDRVTGRISMGAKRGSPVVFTTQQEADLVAYIKLTARIGYSISKPELCEFLSDYAIHNGKRTAPLGSFWMGNFLSRWPELTPLMKPVKMTQDCMDEYYKELSGIVKKYNFTSETVYIVSEKNICLTHAQPCVLNSSSKRQHDRTMDDSKSVTVVAGANALGAYIPPFFVLPNVGVGVSALKNEVPEVGVFTNESGSSDTQSLKEYISTHILQHISRSDDTEGHVLILYDGPEHLLPFEVQEIALKEKIILFNVPPTTDQEPAECFQPLSQQMRNQFHAFASDHPECAMTGESVCQLASKAYSQALSADSVMQSFQMLGILG